MTKKAGKKIKTQNQLIDRALVKKNWAKLECLLAVYRSEKQYLKAVKFLDSLLDEVGEDESHPLSSLAQTIGLLIEEYEERNVPEIEGNAVDALKFLMAEHELVQKDLSFLGSQGVVSEILSGQRELNKRQILDLSSYFQVSPLTFLIDGRKKAKAG